MNVNLRNITNHFQDVRLVSLASWRKANEIMPRDKGGPYVVMQEGFDPQDLKLTPTEFVIGRSGKWLPLAHFYKLPVDERRAEFVFGTAAEVMQMLGNLPPKAEIMGRGGEADAPAGEPDEMMNAIQSAKNQGK